MNTIDELFAYLESPEGEGHGLLVKHIDISAYHSKSISEKADEVVRANGLTPIGKSWEELKPPEAQEMLTRLLQKTLAYGSEIFQEKTAAHMASIIIEHLQIGQRWFLSNGGLYPGGFSIGQPLGSATFELGIVCGDSRQAIFVFSEDED
jgi:hypothetical protein